jgi:hypothetical protein
VVAKCIASGLVAGEGFSIDASLIRADAGKKKRLHDLRPTAAIGRGKDDFGAPNMLLRRVAIDNDRLKAGGDL